MAPTPTTAPGQAGDRPRTFAESKLRAPSLPRAHVPRPELCARLVPPGDAVLTLLVGSPGSGKTTLLAEWHAARPGGSACWLNVDVGDREPGRFWRAVIAAVRTCVPDFGDDSIDLLRLSPRVDSELLESLLVGMASLPGPTTLVLDDLHLAGGEVERQIGFLLSRGTGDLHVVIGSRSEPQIGLSRLRVNQQVVEVRDVDLVFALDAAGTLLAGLGVELESDLLARVVDRTEGWAAGLQLVGIALADCDDPAGLVDRLSGTNGIIAHYLWSEVVAAQPTEVQRFLFDTCVVDELTPGLARVLSPDQDVTLFDLEEAHLLVRRLDDDGHAFTFHQLFTDLLRYRLESDDPEHHAQLHRRAARWFAEHGRFVEACRHAWRSGDAALALELMDGTVLQVDYEAAPLEELERSLSDADVARSPGPSLSLAVALCGNGRIRSADRLVARVEAALRTSPVPEVAQQALAVRAIVAILLGDTATAAAVDAEVELGGIDETWPLMALQVAAKGHVWEGRPRRAIQLMEDVRPRCVEPLTMMEAVCTIAHGRLAVGELDAAAELAAQVLDDLGDGHGVFTDGVLARAVLGAVALERGEMTRAEPILRSVAAVTARVRTPAVALASIALSRAWAHDGDIDAARLALAGAFEALDAGVEASGLLDHLRIQEARLSLGAGDLDAAAGTIELVRPGPLRLLAEADLALATGEPEAARAALEARDRSVSTPRDELESALVRLRLALAVDDGVDEAAASALRLSEPGGFILLLAEAGAAALRAIRAEARRHPHSAHVDAILRLQPPVVGGRPERPRVEALTERERAIVRYMATSLSYREIADELLVSINTVKTHVKHINQKLGVASRDEAVARAQELNYL